MGFSEAGISSQTSEKAQFYYMETYPLQYVSGCDIGLDVRHFVMVFEKLIEIVGNGMSILNITLRIYLAHTV